MPDPISWYALGRDVNDPQTILEAVDEKILTHNLDPSAHGQSDEAIYMHRISMLLDHVNYSIYNIKLHPETRPIKAFVDVGGAAEFSKLQDAVDYVHALGGGKIFVKAGTYVQTADLTLYSDIQLEGDDDDTTIIDFNNTTYRMKAEGTPGTHIKNIRVTHLGIKSSNNGTYEALRFLYADDCEIKNCKFYDNINSSGNGTGDLLISDGLRIYILENRFSSAANINLKGESIYINHNYFDGAPSGGMEGNSIYMGDACHSVKVVDNHFDATIQSAIYIQNNIGASSQIVISNNFFSGADTWMIYADPVESMTITGNIFDNAGIGGGDAINLQGCTWVTISGNVITSFAGDGVHLNSSNKVTIVGNNIVDCDTWGVDIYNAGCNGTVVVGNGMSGNGSGNIHNAGTGSIIANNG